MTPAAARPAATVALLRDTAAGLQVYLLRRVASMAFAAGMHVFPGGSVDPRDADVDRFQGPDPAEWSGVLSCDAGLARELVCAAVRETFEESGVLLAGTPDGQVVPDVTGEAWEADRRALVDRSLAFSDLLERRDLVLRTDLLRPWAHWITPESEPRRFDTRFFVAALPEGQRTRDVGGEADAVTWVRPSDALVRWQAQDWVMLPPTSVTLQELAPHARAEDVLVAAAHRRVRPILPVIRVDEQGRVHVVEGVDLP